MQLFPYFIHEKDHALLGGEQILIGHQVILISHARHIHEKDKVQVWQGVGLVLDAQVEIGHRVVHIPKLGPFPRHGVQSDFLLESAVQNIPGRKRFPPLGQGILGLPDFPFR